MVSQVKAGRLRVDGGIVSQGDTSWTATGGLQLISNGSVSGDDLFMQNLATGVSIKLKATNSPAIEINAVAAGQLGILNSYAANAAVATVLGSLGPTGSRTTVQKWLQIHDGTGSFFIPMW